MTAPLTGDWGFPTRIRFGAGRIAELPEVCREAGMSRPLLVTDQGLRDSAIVQRARDLLQGAGLGNALFAEVQGNPVVANVERGVRVLHAGGHDGVVGFGGGSALDAGKCIAMMAGQTGRLLEFAADDGNWQNIRTHGMAPMVAVPTTAGTGSEVGRSAVATDPKQQRKRFFFHPRMLPLQVISDPELTVGLPPHITAAVGMDAFSHCLEALCMDAWHPMCDGIALEGIRLVGRWLPEAVHEGGNLEARGAMLAAASMGAVAFQKGLGSIHAMSHPCSAVHGTHHGLTNAVLMPYVLQFNRPAIAGKLAMLARLLDLERADMDGFLDWLLDLRGRLGIPHSLAEIGVPADAAGDLAPRALADPLTAENPLPVTEADYRALYEQALEGRIAGL